ncbi:hypothetical protein IW261DRAFT_1427074 [Armillaria novae-zelandiae]|uniref:Ribonuclease H1 N-terminal domain-containing protein n=1 Tax=Armillaria novae-zelandiae TaxID=153914 RepID=A0AA39NHI8_9AGAR|nr:hypothetical protein IW261DRAFT_1427074 [Armillaria novae-zelandiae]
MPVKENSATVQFTSGFIICGIFSIMAQLPPAPTNPLSGYSTEQLAELILALQQLGLITLGHQHSSDSVVPGANSEPSPSHVFSSLGDIGGAPSGWGVTIAGTTAATGTTPVVKKESPLAPPTVTKQPLASLKIAPTPGSPAFSQLPWYMVTVGYEVRIFQGWDQVAPLVLGVSGAVFQHHSSLTSMHAHYASALRWDDVEVVPRPSEDDYNSYDDNDE